MTLKNLFPTIAAFICILIPMTSSFGAFAHAIDEQTAARKLISRLKDKDHEAWVTEGQRYIHANHLDSAMVCYSLIIQNSSQCRDKNEKEAYAVGLNGMGVVYYLYGNYAQAYSMFYNAIKANPDCIDAYQNLAAVYWLFGKYEKSAEHLKEAYRLQSDHGSPYNAVTAYVNLLNIMLQNDMMEGIDSIISQYSIQHPKAGDALDRYAAHLNEGITEIRKGDSYKAIAFFRKSSSPADGLDPRLNIDMEINMAKAFEITHDLDSAVKYAQIALETAQQEGHDDMAVKIGRYLADLLDKSGHHSEAKSIRYDALWLSDSLSNFTEYSKIMNLDFENEVWQYKDEIERKEHERKIHLSLLWGLGIVTILLAFTIWYMTRQRKMLNLKDKKIFENITSESKALSHASDSDVMAGTETDLNQSDSSLADSVIKPAPCLENGITVAATATEKKTATISETEKEYRNKIDPEREKRLTTAISKAMADDKVYLSADFSLGALAAVVGDTAKNVSQVINDKFGKNFYTLLNEKRIESAIRMMNQPEYDNYTIDAIADTLGFKSRSNFSKVFTSITGMSPSTFRKMRNEK